MYQELMNIALDLTWTWDQRIAAVFVALDPPLWEEVGHNPIPLLERLGPAGVDEALRRPEVARALDAARSALDAHRSHPSSIPPTEAPVTVAYFSLEFGVTEVLPIYSGGLGILAGDHLKAASDLGLDLVGVGLLYRKGFGRQRLDDEGRQYEVYPQADFERLPLTRVTSPDGAPLEVGCPLGSRVLCLGVWEARVGRVRLVLLDSDVDGNPPELRGVTDQLYAPEPERRLPQEIVLGIGGMRALRALGVAPTVLHMNEGHGFLVGVERIREHMVDDGLGLEDARQRASAELVFTTHTPIAAGSDYFAPALVEELLGPYLGEAGIPLDRFCDLGRKVPGDASEYVCTTVVGLRMAGCSVGVSRLHGVVSRRIWKDVWPGVSEDEVPIGSVTNAVHLPTWVAPEIADLLSRYVAVEWWDLDPSDPRWEGIERIPGAELWSCHMALRAQLVAFANGRSEGSRLDPDVLTIGFSRRFAPYKRAGLVLSDRERLGRLLADGSRPLQLVFSGKAHPADQMGKDILREVVETARRTPGIAFLPDYDIEVARPVVRGSDVWLNNPQRLLEASGTSGMKAAANGGLNLSVLDGWWDEAYRPELGWAIPSRAGLDGPAPDDGAEAEALYRLLEEEVVPLFYEREGDGLPARWLAMMRASIRQAASVFGARRMVLDYWRDCYAPAADRAREIERLTRSGK